MIRAVQVVIVAALCCLVPAAPAEAKRGKDKWDKRLQKNDSTEVFQTIENIAKAGNVDAAPALIRNGLEFKHPHLSVACGEALRALPQAQLVEHLNKDKDFKKWWPKAAKEKDAARARNLARVLCTWGNPMVDPVVAQLTSGRRPPEVQAESLFMAGELRPDAERRFPKTQDSILSALKGRSDAIKCAACSAAGRWKGQVFLDALEKLVKRDRGDYAGLYAVWAMRQIGWDRGISSFIYVVSKNPKRQTKEANLKAITELATIRDIPDLLSLSKNNSKQDARDAAVLALGRLAWRVQRDLLGAHKKDAPVTGGSGKGGKLPNPKLEVPPEFVDRLIQILEKDKSWEVRDAARQAVLRLGEVARDEVVAAVPNLVQYSENDASLTGMELCGLFGARGAYNDLLKVAQFDDDRTRRMFAARALEGVDKIRAVKDLSTAMRPRRKPKDAEINSLRALGYIRTMESFDAILKVVTSPDDWSEAMRREGEFALERLTARRFGRQERIWRQWLETAKNPLNPRITKFDRAKNRRDAVTGGLYGLTGRTERAVEDGLRWLELQQHALGYWDGNEKGFAGVIHCEPAYTGLCLLAFLGAGYNASSGKYSALIRRATEFLCATQFYDGGFPVTGGGDDSWIYAYLIAMAIWGINESHGLSGDPSTMEPAQWGIDYLVRTQTPGAGWRYGPRYTESDTSCTSWVLMATKMADLIGLDVAQRSWDGVDDWLERCSLDITGEYERLEDVSSDYDHEVGGARKFKAFTSYFELGKSDKQGAQKLSMTGVGMVCRVFMGWKRTHPYLIGCANLLIDYLPEWMAGMNQAQNVAWYHYYWYYGTLAMHQMGGKYWRAWNQKIKKMYPDKQRTSPTELAGSWDPDTTLLNGGRLFSTPMSILSLQTYYRFSPLFADEFGEEGEVTEEDRKAEDLKGLWE